MSLRSIAKIADWIFFFLAMANYIIIKPRGISFEGVEKF
jgi:hypothetical protein